MAVAAALLLVAVVTAAAAWWVVRSRTKEAAITEQVKRAEASEEKALASEREATGRANQSFQKPSPCIRQI